MIITAITQNSSLCARPPARLTYVAPAPTKSLQNIVINPETDFSLARMDKKRTTRLHRPAERHTTFRLRPASQWNGIFPIYAMRSVIDAFITIRHLHSENRVSQKISQFMLQFIKTERYGIDQLGGTLIESTQLMRSKEPQPERGGRIQMGPQPSHRDTREWPLWMKSNRIIAFVWAARWKMKTLVDIIASRIQFFPLSRVISSLPLVCSAPSNQATLPGCMRPIADTILNWITASHEEFRGNRSAPAAQYVL